MILSSTQSIHTSNPLDTTISKRVVNASRPSTVSSQETDSSKEKAAEQAQKQAEQRMISELRVRDREVRAHEAAHKAAGGSLVVGGPSFTYQRGPDGRSYAIGGEVQIDVSPVEGDPEATLQKSQQIRRAALAPADPSPQDMRVASNANQLASRARVEIALQRREEALQDDTENTLEPAQASSGEPNVGASGDTDSSGSGLGSQFNEVSQSSVAISAFTATAQPASTEKSQINQFA